MLTTVYNKLKQYNWLLVLAIVSVSEIFHILAPVYLMAFNLCFADVDSSSEVCLADRCYTKKIGLYVVIMFI